MKDQLGQMRNTQKRKCPGRLFLVSFLLNLSVEILGGFLEIFRGSHLGNVLH